MRYPRAVWRPITVNFRRDRSRGAKRAQAFVCHSQEGWKSLFTMFSDPARRASTHFWIGRDGTVEQYVDTNDTAWANGERNRHGGPDPRIPWAQAAYAAASLNDETISCELEGIAGERITEAQERAALDLIAWVHEAHGLGAPRRHVTVVEHNQLSATACPSNRWPIDTIIQRLSTPALPGSRQVLSFWYPGLDPDIALGKFINQTILHDLAGNTPAQ